jgi:hypothetical protein
VIDSGWAVAGALLTIRHWHRVPPRLLPGNGMLLFELVFNPILQDATRHPYGATDAHHWQFARLDQLVDG